MRGVLMLILGALVIHSPPAAFANVKTPVQIGEPVPATNCDLGIAGWTDPTFYAVPDCGDPIRMGPITVEASGACGLVVVSVNMQHTWIGDINLALAHDPDCDGVLVTTVELMCRAGMSAPDCPGTGCCGCSDDIAGLYSFDDTSTGVVLGDPYSSCYGGSVAPGCYRPVTPLSAFASEDAGGCWYLIGQDGACGDLFYVNSWTLSFGGAIGPSPFGACCLDNGSCQSLLEPGCHSLGGTWLGSGTSCDQSICTPTSARSTTWGGLKHELSH